jgi:hypothetical protein
MNLLVGVSCMCHSRLSWFHEFFLIDVHFLPHAPSPCVVSRLHLVAWMSAFAYPLIGSPEDMDC